MTQRIEYYVEVYSNASGAFVEEHKWIHPKLVDLHRILCAPSEDPLLYSRPFELTRDILARVPDVPLTDFDHDRFAYYLQARSEGPSAR